MQTFFQDFRFSLRTLRKSPGFTLTAILTLALGIGAVTSVFSVVSTVLLKPFAFSDPGQLVSLRETVREMANGAPLPVNFKHYLNWKAQSKTLAGVAIFENNSFSVAAGSSHPEIVDGLGVSPEFFPVLGVTPMLGRNFVPGDTVKGHDDIVILSWEAWQKYFDGDPSAIGKILRLSGKPGTVVGVLPRGFTFPHLNAGVGITAPPQTPSYSIFNPIGLDEKRFSDSGDYDYMALGRLRSGVSAAQASSELAALQQGFAQGARLPQHLGIYVQPLIEAAAGGISTGLWLLLGAVGAVLLIACVNLANLQLARAVAREREVAIRAALGASPERLVQSSLMDSLVLAVAGGALGILLSFTGVRLFIAAAPSTLPRLNEAHVSLPILLFAAGLSMLTALLFGALPALRSLRVDPQSAIQTNSTRVANTREGQRTRSLLVAAEVACTVVLLIVTALLVRSFGRLLGQQRDFDSGHVTLAQICLFAPQYGDDMEKSQNVRAAFMDRALTDLARIPGVQSVAVTSGLPMGGDTWVDGIIRPDHPLPPGQEKTANMRWISPGYTSTLRIPVLAGRSLQPSDKDHSSNVLISQKMARDVWPGEDPVGKVFSTGHGNPNYTVVGIVADARINDLKTTANMVYLPYWQNPLWRGNYLIRSTQPASALADSIRRTVWKIDPQVAIPTLKSLDDQVSDSIATDRFQTMLLSSFGVAALLLALLGVYGVLAYSVSLRQQEFGIRIALGSEKAPLMRLVVRQAAWPVIGGVLAGLGLAFFATRWIASLLYETQTVDPVAIAGSIALLLAAALLAAILPARRASEVDPMQVLRNE